MSTELSDDSGYGIIRDVDVEEKEEKQEEEEKKKTPLSLGIELSNGEMNFLIPKNSEIPYKKTIKYKTTKDYQSKIVLRVFQGERLVANTNEFLGECILENIPQLTKGKVIIDCTLEITTENYFCITLKENINGKQSSLINKINMHENEDKDFFENIYKRAKICLENDKKIIEINETIKKLKDYCVHLMNTGNNNQRDKAKEVFEWAKVNIRENKQVYEKKLNELKKIN